MSHFLALTSKRDLEPLQTELICAFSFRGSQPGKHSGPRQSTSAWTRSGHAKAEGQSTVAAWKTLERCAGRRRDDGIAEEHRAYGMEYLRNTGASALTSSVRLMQRYGTGSLPPAPPRWTSLKSQRATPRPLAMAVPVHSLALSSSPS